VTGTVAVVTGAASGLGAAVSAALADTGVRVAGIDLHPSATDLSLRVDVTVAADVAEAVGRVEATLGAIDVLVTAAGVYEMLEIEQITDERWDRMLAVNLAGTANACAAVLPGMVARGHGSVVTISSDLGIGGSQGDVHYATTKGAIVGLTRSLAREVAGSGVAVNTVAPGAADTPMLDADSPWRAESFLTTLPARTLVPPGEIAAAVLFLVRSGTALVGQVVSPNSGATI
jgi:2-hydroxycyclohexanecarboxyl-CoA dehydrogenase